MFDLRDIFKIVNCDYICSVETSLDFYDIKNYVFGSGVRNECRYILAPNVEDVPSHIKNDIRCHINPYKIKKGLNLIDDYEFVLYGSKYTPSSFYEAIFELKRGHLFDDLCFYTSQNKDYMSLLESLNCHPVGCGNYIVIDESDSWESIKHKGIYVGEVLGNEMVQMGGMNYINSSSLKIVKFRKNTDMPKIKFINYLRIADKFCRQYTDNIEPLQDFMKEIIKIKAF